VNGARCAVLTESTIWIEITAPADNELNGFSGVVDALQLTNMFAELEFDFHEFIVEEYMRDLELKEPRLEALATALKTGNAPDEEFEVLRGFATGKKDMTKDDYARVIKSYMLRLNDLSIESVYMDGESPWLNIREHLFPEGVKVLARCINMDELGRLQKARQLVEDCGMDTSDVKQILTAYRKPVMFRKMFFDGEVRNQTWASLR
jgi:hypothetical protein